MVSNRNPRAEEFKPNLRFCVKLTVYLRHMVSPTLYVTLHSHVHLSLNAIMCYVELELEQT